MKKKYFFILATIFLIISVFIVSSIYDDKKNNIPDSVERFIPKSVKQFLINNLFIKKRLYAVIESHKERIRIRTRQLKNEEKIVDKLLDELYLNGLDNIKFFKVKSNEEIFSTNSIKYKLTTFQTDHLSKGTWPHTKASVYLEKFGDKILLVSKDGIISFLDIEELNNDNFQTKIISSNIKDIINYDDWLEHGGKGLKDILVNNGKLYISYSNLVDTDCYNTSIIVAEINLQYLEFENFFTPPTCKNIRKGFNRWSDNAGAGRIVEFSNESFLFSHGGFKTRVNAQDDTTVYGKIIKINKFTKNWEIVSKGHRNAQGLFFDKETQTILNTEHGPKGGDEININRLNETNVKNFGWPISSYGEHYGGREKNKLNYEEAPLYKSHTDHGFVEPVKYFVPSIGISEIKKVSNTFNDEFVNDFFIGSMGSNISEGDMSIHHIRLNKENNKIIYNDLIQIGERIRDILIIEEAKKIILFLENSAAIGILEM